tara:strand:- start:557 stop:1138 length:582 start_codon:yes stop_codon:yes gene_type:complete
LLKSQSDTSPLDIRQTSESKRDVVYGQDCDDTEYRNEWGTPNWKNYGKWLSECDSIQSVTLDKEFAERQKKQQREKAIQDSIEALEYENIDLDVDAMWENTVWEEIQDVTDVYGEVEQITAVAGVRGAEAEDEALEHLYYRKSMKKLALEDLQKAYGKLKIKRDELIKVNPNHPKLKKIDNLISQLEYKMKKV